MDEHERKAREIVIERGSEWQRICRGEVEWSDESLISLIAAALREEHARTVEACAKVAEQQGCSNPECTSCMPRYIAKRIRERALTPGQGGGGRE